MNANIINFPENKIVRRTPEFAEALKKEGKAKAVEELVDFFVENVYNMLVMNGIEETEILNERDFPMVADTIQALVYRQFDIEHHFHEITDDVFKETEQQPENET